MRIHRLTLWFVPCQSLTLPKLKGLSDLKSGYRTEDSSCFQMASVCSFYPWGNRDLGRLGNLSRVIKQVQVRLALGPRSLGFCFMFLAVLEFELRALGLLDKHSYHLSHTPQLFLLFYLYFQIGSCFCPGQVSDLLFSYLYLPHSWSYRHIPLWPVYYLR
jgi:hypothetical protein